MITRSPSLPAIPQTNLVEHWVAGINVTLGSGSYVASLGNRVAGGPDLAQGTEANQFIEAKEGGVPTMIGATNAARMAWGTTSHTLSAVSVIWCGSPGTFCIPFLIGTSTTRGLLAHSTGYWTIVPASGSVGSASTIPTWSGKQIVGMTCDGSTTTVYANGVYEAIALSTSGSVTGGQMSGWPSSDLGLSGAFNEMAVYGATLSAASFADAVAAVKRSQRMPLLDLAFAIDGDSITAGTGTNTTINLWGYQLARRLGGRYKNPAVSGNQIADLQTRATGTWSTSYRNSGPGAKVAILWSGTNDAPTTSNYTSLYSALVTLARSHRAAGATDVGMVTMLPRTGYSEQGRQAFNDLIVRDPDRAFSFTLDVRNEPRMGRYGTETDTTYYQSGGTHPNDTGMTVLADFFEPRVKAYLFGRYGAAALAGSAA